MRLALYQPDIPQNTGTMIRLGACLSVPIEIIEPCGFTFSAVQLRRAALDYAEKAQITRHVSWRTFLAARPQLGGRLILLTVKAPLSYTEFAFRRDDIVLVGQESVGAPPEVHEAVDQRVRIPMQAGVRSLNVAVAAAMVLGGALRQTGGFAG